MPGTRLTRTGLAAAVAVSALGFSHSAWAFCQTTSCDPFETTCPKDANGCFTTGYPLSWPDLCVTFAVEQHGSEKQGIDANEAQAAVERSFQAWLSADCGMKHHPSIGVVPMGVSYCDQVEYNHPRKGAQGLPRAPNSNTVIFRDVSWPHTGEDSTLALTTVTFSKETGEILDADIEVNSFAVELSVSDSNVKNDLQSILTHEVGHFFGLAHSKAKGSSMNPEYKVNLHDTTFRTLSADDEAGICAIYPPQKTEVTDCTGELPRYGFSRYCSVTGEADAAWFCSTTRPGARTTSYAAALAFGALGLAALRRRRLS